MRNPPERLDTGFLSQLQARTNFVPVKNSEVDTVVNNLHEAPQEVETNSTSEAGAAFGGPVAGGYTAAFHQSWEMPIPQLWAMFTHDTVHITVDAVIQFTDGSFQPDIRKTDAWVWELDVAQVLTSVVPTFVHFRHIEGGMYRAILKVAGMLLGGAHKLRFGFNFQTEWNSGQSQTTTWAATVQLAAHTLTNAVIGREVRTSEESAPLSLTLDENFHLELLFNNSEYDESHTPTEWAML